MTSNVEALKTKLSEMGVKNLSIFPGGKWKDLTAEERAGALLDVIGCVERGELKFIEPEYDEEDQPLPDDEPPLRYA